MLLKKKETRFLNIRQGTKSLTLVTSGRALMRGISYRYFSAGTKRLLFIVDPYYSPLHDTDRVQHLINVLYEIAITTMYPWNVWDFVKIEGDYYGLDKSRSTYSKLNK